MAIPEDVWPSLGKYVYLNTLKNKKSGDNANNLYRTLKSNFSFRNSLSINKYSQTLEETIFFAIDALTRIRDNERIKEQGAITNYLRKIEKYKNDENVPKEIRIKLQKQLQSIQKLEEKQFTPEKIDQEQFNFIAEINIMSQDINAFKRRVTQLNESITRQSTEIDVMKRQEYQREDNTYNFLRDLALGLNESNQLIKKKFDAHFQTIRDDFNQQNPGFGDIVYTIMYSDFQEYLTDLSGEEWNLPTELTTTQKEKLTKALDDYINGIIQKEYLTPFQRTVSLYKDSLFIFSEMQSLIENFISKFGFQFTNKETYEAAKKAKALLDKGELDKTEKDALSRLRKTYKFTSNKAIRDIIQSYEYGLSNNTNAGSFTFKTRTEQSHGFYEEIIRALRKMGQNVHVNDATDTIIPVTTFTWTRDQGMEQDALFSLARRLDNYVLTPMFNQAKNTTLAIFEDAVASHQTLNREIQNQINSTMKVLEQIETDFNQSFIAYETIKTYREYDKKAINTDFTGRDINILTALTELYASTELYTSDSLQNSLIDPDILIVFLLNIHDETVGRKNKNKLERYLSLFAGLLMFDDIANMTREAFGRKINTLETEITDRGIFQLHLFRINGLYIPLSVILNNLITQLNKFSINKSDIDSSKTAQAELTPPDELPDAKQIKDWNQYAEKVIKKTSIKIHFLSAFANYVTDLQKANLFDMKQ